MKSKLLTIVLLTMSILSLSFGLVACDKKVVTDLGLVLVLTNNDTEYEVYDCESDASSIEIPKEYNGKPITSIGDSAFEDCDSLTKIVIPNSVTNMGSHVFTNCWSLTIYCEAISDPKDWSIWSKSWNYITEHLQTSCPVVWNCTNNDVADNGYIYTVIDGVRYGIIDGVATVVEQPRNISTANILSTVTYKGREYTVTTIGSDAFYQCYSLTNVVIPNSVTTIGFGAFFSCDSLISVVIPESVTRIMSAFFGCDKLESVIIPNSVIGIEKNTFGDCNLLTIYCESNSEPSGWEDGWNSSNCPVVWGYKPA